MKRFHPDRAAYIIDQHINTAEYRPRLVHKVLGSFVGAEIHNNLRRLDIVFVELFECTCRRFVDPVCDHDFTAFLAKSPCSRAADTLTSASYYANFILKSACASGARVEFVRHNYTPFV